MLLTVKIIRNTYEEESSAKSADFFKILQNVVHTVIIELQMVKTNFVFYPSSGFFKNVIYRGSTLG